MAIDKDETKKSLFGGLKQQAALEVPKPVTREVKESDSPQVSESRTTELPKWKTFEKITALITAQQRDAIEEFAKKIMRSRTSKKTAANKRERITANTVLRALLDIFIYKAHDLKIDTIDNEDELKTLFQQLFR